MPEQSSVPPSFNEKVYALSKIAHQVKFRNNRSDKYTASQRKHLRLLDDIALLLDTESGSDVAAVSFEQRPTEIIFYFAKNRPATDAEHAYIKDLIELARDTEATNRTASIFNNVLHICRPKMLSRFDKMIRVLTKLAPAARCFEDDTNGDVDRHLQQELGVWYDPKKGAVAFVNTFVSHLSTLAKLKRIPDPAALRQIIRVAHATGSFKPENTVYPDIDLTRRIRLLGDYYGAVKRIVRNADSIIGRAPRTVEFTEIVPHAPIQSRMPTDYLPIVNNHAIQRRIPTISYETLKNAYPDATPLTPEDALKSQRVTYTVHAECTVAVFMASLPRTWEFVEIGCSKGSCWLCERYLSLDTRLKFHVSNVHGKLQPGWTMPPGGDDPVNAHIVESIGDELEEVVLRAVGSRRSDSEPRSGSDSEHETKNEPDPTEGVLYWMI